MTHQIREGIVLKNICGEWLLIAVGDAANDCLYVRQINETMAYFWQLIEEGRSTEEIINQAQEDYDAPVEVIRRDVHNLIKNLYDMNYLIRSSEE